MVAQWIECQIASVVVPGSNPGVSEAGTSDKVPYHATGGQDVDGGPGLIYLLDGWFWSRFTGTSMELSPTVCPAC